MARVAREVLRTLAVGCAFAVASLPLVTRLPNAIIADDGYFYAQIAYHLGLHGRSPFDGIHITNGYHLPWALLLGGVSRALGVVTTEKPYHLIAHLAVALSMALGTARYFFKRPASQLCAFVLIVANFSLTEMVLAAPILLGLLRSTTREEPRRRGVGWRSCCRSFGSTSPASRS